MNLNTPLLKTIFSALLLLLLGGTAQAGDGHKHHHRQHASHQHGHGQLDIALSGTELHMEFHSPAINLVGFEHAPKNSAQKSLIDTALSRLRRGKQLFELDKTAQCQFASAMAKTNQVDLSKRPHDKKQQPQDDHGDFSAIYKYECAKPMKLHTIQLRLFKFFPDMKTVKVRLITEQGQHVLRLTAINNTLRLPVHQ